MKNWTAVAMSDTLCNLFENVFCFIFSQLLAFFYKMVKITAPSVFHDHHNMLFVFKHFIKSNYVRVSYFFKDIHLLEYLLARVFVLQLAKFYHFNGYKLPCQFLDGQVDLSKSTITNLFDEFVKVETCGRELLILSHVLSVVFNDLFSFSHNFIVQLLMLSFVQMLLSFMDRSGPCCSIRAWGAFSGLNRWLLILVPLPHSKRFVISLSSAISTATGANFWVMIDAKKLLHSISSLLLMRSSPPLLGMLN